MTARFEHQTFADVVVVLFGLVSLLEESPGEWWEAGVDDAGGFSSGVHVDAADGLVRASLLKKLHYIHDEGSGTFYLVSDD